MSPGDYLTPKGNDISKLTESEIQQLIVELHFKLNKMEMLLNQAQKSANSGSFLLDENDKLTWSDNTFDLFGWNKSDVEPQLEVFYDHVIQHDRDYVKNIVEMTFSTGRHFDISYRWIGNDGKVKFINSVGGLTIDEKTGTKFITGVSTDVTNKNTIEEEIRKAARKLHAIIETSHDGYFVLNEKGFITEFNKAFESMTGYDSNELLKMSISQLDVIESVNDIKEHIKKVTAQGWDQFITKHKRKDGSIITLEISTSYIHTTVPAFICFARDVTSAQLEKELLEARFRIEEYSYSHSLDELLQKCLDETEELTNSKIGFYHFVEEDQENLHLQMWSTNTLTNMCTAEGKGSHYAISKAGVWVDCVKTKKPIVHNDYESLKHKKGLPEGHAPVIRELVVPVIKNNKIKAILGVGNKKSNYDSYDIEVVTKLADLAWDIVERKHAEEARNLSEQKFQELFDDAPVPIWEEDFSEIKRFIDQRKNEGVTDFREYFEKNPEDIYKCAGLIKILSVNKESLRLFGVKCKEELEFHLPKYFIQESWVVFTAEIVALAEGNQKFESEIEICDLNGNKRSLQLAVSIALNSLKTWERVTVSFLDITQKKKSERLLRANEQKFRHLYEDLPVGSVIVDFNSRFISANKAFCNFIGYTEDELIGKSVAEISFPDDVNVGKEEMKKLFNGIDEIPVVEKRYIRKDGKVVWGSVYSRLLKDDEGRPQFYIPIIKDITDRKLDQQTLKESEEKLRQLVEKVDEAFYMQNFITARFEYVTPQIESILGYSINEILNMELAEQKAHLHPEDLPRLTNFGEDLYEAYKRGEKLVEHQFRIRHKSGKYIWIQGVYSLKCDLNNAPTMIVGSIRDITIQKEAEQSLKDSRRFVQATLDALPSHICILDENGVIKAVNKAWKIFAEANPPIPENYGIGVNYFGLCKSAKGADSSVAKKIADGIQDVINEKVDEFVIDYPCHSASEQRWFAAKVTKFSFLNAFQIVITHENITSLKRNEQALIESEMRLQFALQNSEEGVWDWNITTNEVFFSTQLKEMLGYNAEEIGTSLEEWKNRIHPMDLEEVFQTLEDYFGKKTSIYQSEHRLKCKSGSYKWILDRGKVVEWDDNGNPVRMIGTHADINKRKEIEASLEEEKRLFNKGKAVVFKWKVVDPEAYVLFVSRNIKDQFGYDPHELINSGISYFQLIHPEDYERIDNEIRSYVNAGIISFEQEYRFKHANGEYRWVYDFTTTEYDEKGEIDHFQGYIIDITERKNAEKKLQLRESQLSQAMNAARLGHWEHDIVNDKLMFNDEFYALFKTDIKKVGTYELSSKEYAERFVHPDDLEIVPKAILEALQSKENDKVFKFEHKVIFGDGTTGYIGVQFKVIKNELGETIKTVGVNQDITERVLQSHLLKTSEENYKALFEENKDAITLFPIDETGTYHNFTQVNKAACDLLGYSKTEFLNLTVTQIDSCLTEEIIINLVKETFNTGFALFETVLVCKNGKLIPAEMKTSIVIIDSKKYLMTMARDISERKIAEERIKKSEVRYHSLYDAITDGIIIIEITDNDEPGAILDVNETVASNLGYSKEELFRTSPLLLETGLTSERLEARKKKLKENRKANFEADFIHKNGSIVPMEVNASFVLYNDKPAIMNLAKDITERKEAERKLRESEKKYRLLAENINDVIWIMDAETEMYSYLSPSAEKLRGFSHEEMMNQPVIAAVPSEYTERFRKEWLERAANFMADPTKEKYYVEEIPQLHKDGFIVWTEVASTLYFNEETRKLEVHGFTKDISERKTAELILKESEEKLRSYIDNAPDAIFVVDTQGYYRMANPAACQLFGYTPEEFNGIIIPQMLHPEELEQGLQHFSTLKQTGKAVGDFRMPKKNGEYVFVTVDAVKLTEDSYLGFIKNISARKKAELELMISEAKFKSYVNNSPTGIMVTNKDGIYTDVNPAACKIFGYTKEEIIGRHILEYSKPKNLEAAKNHFEELLLNGSSKGDIITTDKHGNELTVYVETAKLNDDCFIGFHIDVTDRVKIESALKQSEENLSTFFNTVKDFLWVLDENGNILSINKTVEDRLGYNIDELRNTSVLYVHPESRRDEAAQIVKEMLLGSSNTCSVPLQAKNGKLIPVETYISTGTWNGMPALFGVSKDISALKLSEEKFSKAFHNSPVIIGISDLEVGGFVEVNQEFLNKFEYSMEEVRGKKSSELLNIDKEFRASVIEKLSNNGSLKNIEIIAYSKTGKAFNLLMSAEVIEINEKKYNYTTAIDITDRKIAESALKESQQNLITLINSTPDIICFKDGQGRWLKANIGILSLYELTGVDYKGKTERELAQYTNPIYQEGFRICNESDEVAWKYGVQSRSEEVIPRANGENRFYDVIKIPLFNDDGSRKALVVFGRDVTERRFMENELRESEEKFRKSFMTSPDAVNINRMHDGLYIEINEGFTKMTGYTLEDVKGKTSSEITIWTNPEDRKRLVNELLENGVCRNLEAQFRFKDGSIHTGLMSASPIMVQGEKCILSITRDISERKIAENSLRESEEKFKALFNMSPDAIFVLYNGQILYANESSLKLLKYPSLEDILKVTALDIIHPDYHEIVKERMKIVNEDNKEVPPLYEKFICYDGSIVDVEVVGAQFEINNKKVFQVLARDITERLKNEKRIKLQRDLNLELINVKNINEAAKSIFSYAKLMLEVDCGGLYITTKEGGLKIVESFGFSANFRKYIQYHASDSRNVRMIQSGNSIFVNYNAMQKSGSTEMLTEGLKTVSVIPLIFEGEIVAVLNFASHVVKEFSEQQRNLIETFAFQCGAFIGRLITESELKASEQKFRNFFEADLAGDYKSLLDGTLIECNNAFIKMLEFSTKEEALATNMHEIYLTKVDRNSFLAKLKKRKFLEQIETKLITRKGKEVIVLENVLADYDEKGNFVGVTGYMIDVTKMKLNEKALIESEKNYRELFRSMQSGFALHEIILNENRKPVDYRFISVNPMFEKLTTLKEENIIGKTVFEVLPQTEKYWIDTYGKVALTGKPITFENYSKELGKYFKVVVYSPEKYKFATIIEDITDAKISEAKIRQLSTAVEQSSVAIVITELSGNIEYINPMFTKLTGYTFDEVIGKSINILNTERFSQKESSALWKKINAGKDWRGIFRNKKKNGELYWESSSISPIKDTNGKITHFISFKEDISEKIAKDEELESYKNHLEEVVELRTNELHEANVQLKQEIIRQQNTQELLKDALSKEKELNELKTRFISTTSHEFRTPLTSVLSSAELMHKYGKKWSEDKINEHTNRIRRSVDYLVKLLDDILTISRTESGKINFSPQVVNVKEFCIDLIEEAKTSATDKHKLILRYTPKNTMFNLDLKLLKFILLNLVVNAIKYSPGGGKVILAVESDSLNITFRVSDKGIGIPNDEKAYIFDSFYRSKNSVDIPGTGLGLAIVKKSVDLHQGNISLVSQINVGTTFTVNIPKRLKDEKQ